MSSGQAGAGNLGGGLGSGQTGAGNLGGGLGSGQTGTGNLGGGLGSGQTGAGNQGSSPNTGGKLFSMIFCTIYFTSFFEETASINFCVLTVMTFVTFLDSKPFPHFHIRKTDYKIEVFFSSDPT